MDPYAANPMANTVPMMYPGAQGAMQQYRAGAPVDMAGQGGGGGEGGAGALGGIKGIAAGIGALGSLAATIYGMTQRPEQRQARMSGGSNLFG